MMVIRTPARVLMLALVLAGATLSCAPDDGTGPSPGPQYSSQVQEVTTPPSPDMYRIEERLSLDLLNVLQVSQVIGIGGGSLHLLGHTLTVPAGAVSLPTVFTLIVLPNGYVEVDLKALRLLTNVGARGFNKPVPVTLTYARATNVSDPSRLRIMRLKADGRHEVLSSVVNTTQRTVTAELSHFSRYCMVSD